MLSYIKGRSTSFTSWITQGNAQCKWKAQATDYVFGHIQSYEQSSEILKKCSNSLS